MKKKFWIGILAAFLLLTLWPTAAFAAEDSTSPETIYRLCKFCNKNTDHIILGYSPNGSGSQHNEVHYMIRECTVCHRQSTVVDSEDEYKLHTGGDETPTCTTGKTCKLCGAQYGILGHDWGEWKSNGNGTHFRTCKRKDCGAVDTANCSGDGSATCVTQGTCTACGAAYYGGHYFPKPYKYEYDENTHWRACSYCDEGKADEAPHSFVQGHDYSCIKSEATCVSPRVYYMNCSTCIYRGTETYEDTWYGLNPNNHTGNEEIRDAVAATCTQDGYTGDTYCKDCDTKLASGKAIPAAGHTGGTATCLWRPRCEVCGEKYGNIARWNHAPGCEPEWTVTETEHEQKYSWCGAIATEKGAHTFGDWTVTREATPDETGEQERICELCDYTETEEIPVVETEESLAPAPTAEPVPAAEPAAESAEPVSTSSIWWIVALGVIAGAAAGVAVRRKKKK